MRELAPLRVCVVLAAALVCGCEAPLPNDPNEAEEEAARLLELAYEELDAGRWESGRTRAERALRLRRHADAGPIALAEAHAHVAWAHLGDGDLTVAADHESTVARLCALVDPGRNDLRTYALHLLGNAHYARGNPTGAIRWWQTTLTDLRAAAEPDPESIAWVGNDLADQLRRVGSIVAAESLQVEMVHLARRKLGAGGYTPILLNNLGALYWDQDRLTEAEVLYREALEVSWADSSATTARRAIAHLNLGVLQHDQARWEASRENLERALQLSREGFEDGDPQRVMFLLERGRLAASTRAWKVATELWEEALSILDRLPESPPMYEAFLRQALGEARLARGQAVAAAEEFERAATLRKLFHGERHAEVGASLAGLAAAAHAAEHFERARIAAGEAIGILEASDLHTEQRALALVIRARLERRNGDHEAARSSLAAALNLVEALRPHRGGGDRTRARFLQDYVGWYGERIAISVQRGAFEDALLDAERMRARVLRDRLQRGGVDLLESVPAGERESLAQRRRAARATIGAAQRELAHLRATWTTGDDETARQMSEQENERDAALRELRDVESRIEAAVGRTPLTATVLRPSELDLDSIVESALDDGEIALYYQLDDHRSHVFAIESGTKTIRAWPLAIEDDEARTLGVEAGPLTPRRLRGALAGLGSQSGEDGDASRGVVGLTAARPEGETTARAGSETSVPLNALLRILLPIPLRESLAERDRALILPDGDLHRVPFEMLVWSIDESGPRYWLDEGPILRYAHSLSTSAATSVAMETPAERDLVVSVCDPAFARAPDESSTGPVALRPLPGTRRESESLAALYPAEILRVLAGREATESALKSLLPRARLLHLATHGLVDERGDALLASLALAAPAAGSDADPERDDGFLHLFEIYELDLAGCELAVLSACETQLGEQVRGEGVFALSRGFLAAGARRTVASLWPVSDRSTSELMAIFFAQLARAEESGEGVDHALALRDAKRSIRGSERWTSPFHWAPFVLSGSR